MPYINDKTLFKAVSFASSMKFKGTPTGLAIFKAAKYYNVDQSKVALELGKRRKCFNEKNGG